MSVSNAPIYIQQTNSSSAQILPATGTGLVTLYTAASNAGSKIENIILTNNDTANSYDITFTAVISSVSYILGTVTVPVAPSATKVSAVSVMQNGSIPFSYDAFGNPYMYLAVGAVLKINSGTTVATSKTVSAICTAAGDL